MRRSWSWMSGATALAAAIGAFAPPTAAQYFGQNKGQYRKLEFQVIQTEHFQVYYYGEERAAALDAARMAEYLSCGPIGVDPGMWLREAALEGNVPTIEEMPYGPRVFPYHFGHALWSYIGEKWGDEVIGETLQASTTSGIEGAFKRALGVSLDDLSSEWRDAGEATHLPQLAGTHPGRPPRTGERRGGEEGRSPGGPGPL